jgi:hypothetical protein
VVDISRRGFLGGVAAAAVVAALPIPAPLPESYMMILESGPIFEGAVGVYNGVIFRTVPFIRSGKSAPHIKRLLS